MTHSKIPVAILGATGTVGQWFVKLLADHPWFDIVRLTASERSQGKPYAEACHWTISADIPPKIAKMIVEATEPDGRRYIAFSGLDASVAGPVETAFAEAGCPVLSNARNHRLEPDVPLLIPEINPEHLQLISRQRENHPFGSGFIVTNPNCSTIALALALAPLERSFGLEQVIVTTMQAVSGAGYPGHPAIDMLGNVIPFIGGEEEKIAIETKKILGTFQSGRIAEHALRISASTNRVPVIDGHLGNAFVKFSRPPAVEEAIQAFRNFKGLPQELQLPSAPRQPIMYRPERDRPQTRRDALSGDGMAVVVGRVRPSDVLDMKFVFLGHNTIRGAAGASILNAELLNVQGYFDDISS